MDGQEREIKDTVSAIATQTVAAVSERYDLLDEATLEDFNRDVKALARHNAVAAEVPSEEIDTVVGVAYELGLHRRAEARLDQQRWSQRFRATPGSLERPEDPSTNRAARRVNVNFSEQAYRTLEGLARQTGRSMSDVLRDAIALKAWFEQTRAEGGHVLVEHPDGKIREIISV